jgi:Pheophorbide a oxygenase
MLSVAEKTLLAEAERTSTTDPLVIPRFQAEIKEAAQHDPILKSLARRDKSTTTTNWTTTVAYYEPNHIRYQRKTSSQSHVELFMCPVAPGKSRFFISNAMEILVQDNPPRSFIQRLAQLTKPKQLQAALFKRVISNILNPKNPQAHLLNHLILDGDGIFLHKQGHRMHEANLSYTNYSTPSSADVLLNAYRRFVEACARKSPESLAQVVRGSPSSDLSRSQLLDRYNTHTATCPTCKAALQSARRQKAVTQSVKTLLQGSTGALIVMLGSAVYLKQQQYSLPARSITGLTASLLASVGTTVMCKLRGKRLDKKIEGFLFQDYVHADKD